MSAIHQADILVWKHGFNVSNLLPTHLKDNHNLHQVCTPDLWLSIAGDRQSLIRELQPIEDKAFQRMIDAIKRVACKGDHPYHNYDAHFQEVLFFIGFLSRELNLPKADAQLLTFCALAHDVSHSGERFRQITKKGSEDRLSNEEVAAKEADEILVAAGESVSPLFRLLTNGIILSSAVMQLNPPADIKEIIPDVQRPYVPFSKLEKLFSLSDISKALIWTGVNEGSNEPIALAGSLDLLREQRRSVLFQPISYEKWLEGERFFVDTILRQKIEKLREENIIPEKLAGFLMARVDAATRVIDTAKAGGDNYEFIHKKFQEIVGG